MPSQLWKAALATAQVDGPALTASTTPTSLLPAHAKITLPSGYFDTAGKKLKIKASGRISNIVTTPGTLTLDIRFNATPIIVFNGGAIPLNIVAKTNVLWELEIDLVCRTIGSGTAATMFGTGKFLSESVISAVAGTMNVCGLPASAPAVGTGFDSTAANLVDLFGTWSLNNANSIMLHHYELESSN